MNIDKNATVVDVRTPEEFAGQHFPGAINIPLVDITRRINEFKQFQKPIIAYCRSGNRSGIAAAMLKRGGIADVVNGGGLNDMFQAKTN